MNKVLTWVFRLPRGQFSQPRNVIRSYSSCPQDFTACREEACAYSFVALTRAINSTMVDLRHCSTSCTEVTIDSYTVPHCNHTSQQISNRWQRKRVGSPHQRNSLQENSTHQTLGDENNGGPDSNTPTLGNRSVNILQQNNDGRISSRPSSWRPNRSNSTYRRGSRNRQSMRDRSFRRQGGSRQGNRNLLHLQGNASRLTSGICPEQNSQSSATSQPNTTRHRSQGRSLLQQQNADQHQLHQSQNGAQENDSDRYSSGQDDEY